MYMYIDEFKIGEIVAITSHPYSENLSNIIISGDASQIPPLFVIIEVLKKNKIPK